MATRGKPHPLPTALSTFIGREQELAEVQRLLRTTRLLTLTGPGGCGKTRLALQAASALLPEFENGVWLTEFAPLADGGLVPQAVASTLGVHEQPGRPLSETLAAHLGESQALLVFDNCEHLVGACAALAETLLQACPNLRILATSRETLNLPGETSWVVPPLSLPAQQPWRSTAAAQQALSAYEQSEAVRLFLDRATAAAPDFRLTLDNGPWVAEICRRLDGMPLAIELAAARVRALSPRQIAERLEDRFRLLTGGSRTAPPRHQSLAAMLDWSYSLLAPAEQLTLQRLAVFAGGWSLAAAEAVCAGAGVAHGDVLDTLTHLVDKSLVTASGQGDEMRYQLLETIRQYASQRLAEAGAAAATRERHLDFFIAWAEQAEAQLRQPRPFAWLAHYEAEHDNLRTALDWTLTQPDLAPKGLRLASLTGRFWRLHGYHSEGRQRLAAALAQPGAQAPACATDRLRALKWAGWLAFFQSDYTAVRTICQATLDVAAELGAAGLTYRADGLEMLAEVETEEGDYLAARPHYDEALALFRSMREMLGMCNTLTMLGWLAMRTGDFAQADSLFETALSECRALGDAGLIGQALSARGELAVRQAQYPLANTFLEESLAIRRSLGEDWGTAISLGTLAWVALRQGDFQRTRDLLGESLAIRRSSGDVGGSAWCLERLAEAHLLQGQTRPAAQRPAYFRQAAQGYAAAAGLRARAGGAMDAADVPEYDGHLAALRAGLGQAPFEAAWARGRALTLEQATQAALAAPEGAPAGVPEDGAPAPNAPPNPGGLTARERQVAALIAQGKSNRQIAEALVVSVRTAETYVTRIMNKLGFDTRVQIATWAMAQGLASGQPH